MKLKRSTYIPVILALYLAGMAYIGYGDYSAGHTSALQYFGVIGITSIIIIVLHFAIKRRDRLRRERLDDINRSSSDNQ